MCFASKPKFTKDRETASVTSRPAKAGRSGLKIKLGPPDPPSARPLGSPIQTLARTRRLDASPAPIQSAASDPALSKTAPRQATQTPFARAALGSTGLTDGTEPELVKQKIRQRERRDVAFAATDSPKPKRSAAAKVHAAQQTIPAARQTRQNPPRPQLKPTPPGTPASTAPSPAQPARPDGATVSENPDLGLTVTRNDGRQFRVSPAFRRELDAAEALDPRERDLLVEIAVGAMLAGTQDPQARLDAEKTLAGKIVQTLGRSDGENGETVIQLLSAMRTGLGMPGRDVETAILNTGVPGVQRRKMETALQFTALPQLKKAGEDFVKGLRNGDTDTMSRALGTALAAFGRGGLGSKHRRVRQTSTTDPLADITTERASGRLMLPDLHGPEAANADFLGRHVARNRRRTGASPGHPPYDPRFPAFTGRVAREREVFVRIVPDGKRRGQGAWLMRKSDFNAIMQSSGGVERLRDLFALPEVPRFFTEIILPRGHAGARGDCQSPSEMGPGRGGAVRNYG